MSEPWLGHWNGCSSQWSTWCDCDPDNPVNLVNADDGEIDEEDNR